MRLSTGIIGIIIIGMVISVIFFLIGDINKNYSSSITTSQFGGMNNTFNKIDELNNLTLEAKANLDTMQVNPSWFDKLNAFVANSWIAAKTLGKSYDTLDTMTTESMAQVEGGSLFVIGLKAIALIVIIIGVLASSLMKWRF